LVKSFHLHFEIITRLSPGNEVPENAGVGFRVYDFKEEPPACSFAASADILRNSKHKLEDTFNFRMNMKAYTHPYKHIFELPAAV